MTKIFNTTQSDLLKYNGMRANIIRELTSDEADINEVGMMYKIQFTNGDIIDAFEDELQ